MKEVAMEALVQMSGYVGNVVNHRSTPSGVAVADFRLGCTPRIRRDGEWVDGETTWITVKAFRALADNVRMSVQKGDPVLVVGRLRTAVWVKDNETFERLELDAVTVGHDLRRGSAIFHRALRAAPVAPESLESQETPETADGPQGSDGTLPAGRYGSEERYGLDERTGDAEDAHPEEVGRADRSVAA